MTQPNKSGLRGCLTSRALRIVLFLLAILLLGSVFVYLLNDDDRGPVSPEMMDEAATGQKKSVYDTLDVLGNYLWRDVMKSAKADSALRADREREAKERAERRRSARPWLLCRRQTETWKPWRRWGRNPPRPCLRLRLLRSLPWLLPR